MSLRKLNYKPKENLHLNVRASQDGLVALSAVDSAIFTLRPNYQDPVSMVTLISSHFIHGNLLCFIINTQIQLEHKTC